MPARLSCLLVNSLFGLAYRREHARWVGVRDVRGVQETGLARLLLSNADTAYGRRHGFAGIGSVEEFQRRVPVTGYEDYLPYVQRIAAGEPGVLTREPVLLLEPSSGSTTASKLIPYTRGLRAQFQAGLRPWLYDLYARYPRMRRGRAFWVVTPPASARTRTPGGIPVGFDDDRGYFGAWQSRLLSAVLLDTGERSRSRGLAEASTPSGLPVERSRSRGLAEVSTPSGLPVERSRSRGLAEASTPSELPPERGSDMVRFYDEAATALLGCADLTLVSVWNPSLLLLIVRHIETHADRLLADLARTDRARASWVSRCLERGDITMAPYARIWPRLEVVSCWADAAAGAQAERLRPLFPHAVIQPKGLLATEGFVSFPLSSAGGSVLSVGSHFFEFAESETGELLTADALAVGGTYSVVLTTAGGLYRYRLNDLVEVTGRHGALPVLRLVGRADHVSDRFGEKLNEVFVRSVLDRLGLGGGFAMLAPEADHYVLYAAPDAATAAALDAALRENFHYDHCRKLGQLGAPRVFALTGDPAREYLAGCVRAGQRLGDIKPTALSLRDGWDRVFVGRYV